MRENETAKAVVLEFLSFLQYKVENDHLTMSEIESFASLFEESLNVLGTADDFAKFYNQSKTNVSSVINRGLMEKPTRKVYYKFRSFRKIIPNRWRNHK